MDVGFTPLLAGRFRFDAPDLDLHLAQGRENQSPLPRGWAARAPPLLGAVLWSIRFATFTKNPYLGGMRSTFQPCLPTGGKVVPATPDWFHEVKYDGYRLIVQRNGSRVRLFSRNGNDWTGRYPWIVESAFAIDSEAVILGVDGVSDFNALHSRQHEDEVQLYAFDILALDGED